MSEYHIGLSERFIFSAQALCNQYGLHDEDTMRAVCVCYQMLTPV